MVHTVSLDEERSPNRVMASKEASAGRFVGADGLDWPRECPVCYETFFSWGQFRVHLDDCINPRLIHCPSCYKMFPCSLDVKTHLANSKCVSHPTRKEFECPHCHCRFKTKEALQQHTVRNHACASRYNNGARASSTGAAPSDSDAGRTHRLSFAATNNSFHRPSNGLTQQFLTANNVDRALNLPPRAMEIVPLMNPSDPQLCAWWTLQLSAQTKLMLANIHAFVVLSSLEANQDQHSLIVMGAWRDLVGARQNHSAPTGLCCGACWSLRLSPSTTNDGFQFIDLDPNSMYSAIRALLVHLKSCPHAYSKTAALQQFSLEDESLPLKAFLKWFCDSYGICKRPAHPAVGPSLQQRQLARNAVARYNDQVQCREETILRDLTHAISSAMVKTSRGNDDVVVVFASDLTEVPSFDATMIEFPFYLQILEHIEIVRITGEEHASRLGEACRQTQMDSMVVFQCKCCHGKFCPREPRNIPFVICTDDESRKIDLMCKVIQLIYHHLPTCPEVPKSNKLKMLRLIPDAKTEEFKEFAGFLSKRIAEWVSFVRTQVAAMDLAASIPASEHVPIWRPINNVNEFLQDDDYVVSAVAHIPKEVTPPPCDSECHYLEDGPSTTFIDNSDLEEIEYSDYDVIEGDIGFAYAGNIRFHEVVAGFRNDFLSTMHPEERNMIAERVVAEIQECGGSFRSVNPQGTCRLLLYHEAVQRSRAALEKGNDNDVIEGIAGADDFVGNGRFRVVVAELRDEFLSTSNPQERIKIAERVVHKIQARGGLFLSLTKHGCMHLSEREAIQRSSVALEKGFSNLLQPQPACGRQGAGSQVLEYEVAPRYDVLSGDVCPSELVRFPSQYGTSQSPLPLRLPASQDATLQSHARVGLLPTNNGAAAAQSRNQDGLPTRNNDAVHSSHAQASLPNSTTSSLTSSIGAVQYRRPRVSLPASNGAAAQSLPRVSLPASNGAAAQSLPRVSLPPTNGAAAQSLPRVGLPPTNGAAAQSLPRVGLPNSNGVVAQSLPQKRACLEAMCKEIVHL